MGGPIDLNAIPSPYREILCFAAEVAQSALDLLDLEEHKRIRIVVSSGSVALAAACYDPAGPEQYVNLDGLAPFQFLDTLKRLDANARFGTKSALIWLRVPEALSAPLVEILVEGRIESPKSALTEDVIDSARWALGFLALHEVGHLAKKHIGPGSYGILTDLTHEQSQKAMPSTDALPRSSDKRDRLSIRREAEADGFAAKAFAWLVSSRGTVDQDIVPFLRGAGCIFLLQDWLAASRRSPDGKQYYPSGYCRLLLLCGAVRQLANRSELVDEICHRVLDEWKAAGWDPSRDRRDIEEEVRNVIELLDQV